MEEYQQALDEYYSSLRSYQAEIKKGRKGGKTKPVVVFRVEEDGSLLRNPEPSASQTYSYLKITPPTYRNVPASLSQNLSDKSEVLVKLHQMRDQVLMGLEVDASEFETLKKGYSGILDTIQHLDIFLENQTTERATQVEALLRQQDLLQEIGRSLYYQLKAYRTGSPDWKSTVGRYLANGKQLQDISQQVTELRWNSEVIFQEDEDRYRLLKVSKPIQTHIIESPAVIDRKQPGMSRKEKLKRPEELRDVDASSQVPEPTDELPAQIPAIASYPEPEGEPIIFHNRKNSFLSLGSKHRFEYEVPHLGKVKWATLEHFIQALPFLTNSVSQEYAKKIISSNLASQAVKLGTAKKLPEDVIRRADWNQPTQYSLNQTPLSVRDIWLRSALESRFRQNPKLVQQLLATGDKPLVYHAKDLELGDGSGTKKKGNNLLGKLLMELRHRFQTEQRQEGEVVLLKKRRRKVSSRKMRGGAVSDRNKENSSNNQFQGILKTTLGSERKTSQKKRLRWDPMVGGGIDNTVVSDLSITQGLQNLEFDLNKLPEVNISDGEDQAGGGWDDDDEGADQQGGELAIDTSSPAGTDEEEDQMGHREESQAEPTVASLSRPLSVKLPDISSPETAQYGSRNFNIDNTAPPMLGPPPVGAGMGRSIPSQIGGGPGDQTPAAGIDTDPSLGPNLLSVPLETARLSPVPNFAPLQQQIHNSVAAPAPDLSTASSGDVKTIIINTA